jgi:CheY-like chemotaxis protein
VVLPLAHGDDSSLAHHGGPDAGNSAPPTRVTGGSSALSVAYIEDNLANVRLMERLAERRPGVSLVHAIQGRLGLDLVTSSPPDLIFLDLHLPDMSGEEVLRRLMAEPATRDIPTVVVSADANPSQVRRVIEIGARGYLTKPFDVEEVLAWFDEVLGVKKGRP